jgi:hypothetical protein
VVATAVVVQLGVLVEVDIGARTLPVAGIPSSILLSIKEACLAVSDAPTKPALV